MKLERNREQWEKCDPEAMSKMSQSAIYFALKDAKHDILALHAELLARAALTAGKMAQAEPVPVEVWHGERKVTIYPDCVLRVWGTNIESEMSDAARNLQTVQDAMDWLYAAPPAQTVQSGEPSYAPYGWVGKGNYWTQMESEAAKHHPMTLVYVPTNASPQPAQTAQSVATVADGLKAVAVEIEAMPTAELRALHEGSRDGDIATALRELRADAVVLDDDQVEWVVNDIAELGVKIGNQFFWLYKGTSLIYETARHDDDSQMHWRHVFKREFGECAHPINHNDYSKIGTVSLDDSDDWKPLPAAQPAQTQVALTEVGFIVQDDVHGWHFAPTVAWTYLGKGRALYAMTAAQPSTER